MPHYSLELRVGIFKFMQGYFDTFSFLVGILETSAQVLYRAIYILSLTLFQETILFNPRILPGPLLWSHLSLTVIEAQAIKTKPLRHSVSFPAPTLFRRTICITRQAPQLSWLLYDDREPPIRGRRSTHSTRESQALF